MSEGIETSVEDEVFVVRFSKATHLKEATSYSHHGATLVLKGNVTIGKDVEFRVIAGGSCVIGRDAVIGDAFRIHGRDIVIERSFWSGRNCTIGGGSCFEPSSNLKFGYFGHMGDLTYVNTARPVTIGAEVGLGTATRLYTHGAYLDFSAGFPVEFGEISLGNNVWLPQATVLPNVKIGNDVVVAAGSVVHKDLPSGCLAGGIPAKVLRESAYPNHSQRLARIRQTISDFKLASRFGKTLTIELMNETTPTIRVADAAFDVCNKTISGKATKNTEIFRDHLRRYGIRFPFEIGVDGYYHRWIQNL